MQQVTLPVVQKLHGRIPQARLTAVLPNGHLGGVTGFLVVGRVRAESSRAVLPVAQRLSISLEWSKFGCRKQNNRLVLRGAIIGQRDRNHEVQSRPVMTLTSLIVTGVLQLKCPTI